MRNLRKKNSSRKRKTVSCLGGNQRHRVKVASQSRGAKAGVALHAIHYRTMPNMCRHCLAVSCLNLFAVRASPRRAGKKRRQSRRVKVARRSRGAKAGVALRAIHYRAMPNMCRHCLAVSCRNLFAARAGPRRAGKKRRQSRLREDEIVSVTLREDLGKTCRRTSLVVPVRMMNGIHLDLP